MGKLSQALGIGVKGRVGIVIDKERYQAGETVSGVVKVHIVQPIECATLVLTIRGCETIKWYEPESHCSRMNEFLLEELVLNELSGLYPPGDYDFPFTYRLRDTLPGSHELQDRAAKHISAVCDTLQYTLWVRLPVTTRLAADLSTIREVIVIPAPNSIESLPVVQILRKEIRTLGMFLKGNCSLTLKMDRDVFLVGEAANICVVIENLTDGKKLAGVWVRIHEDIAVNIPDRGITFGTQVVLEKKIPNTTGVTAKLIDEQLALPLVNTQGVPLAPNTNAAFIRWRHRIAVECKYKMAGKVEVETQIYIMRHNPVPAMELCIGKPPMAVRIDGASWF